MSGVPFWQVDAFAARPFGGNPAAVMVLEDYPADDVLQAVAAENNLAETAFLVAEGDDWRLRWFTPAAEVPLCGHATLASGHVLLGRDGGGAATFHTASGPLTVRRDGPRLALDLPALASRPDSDGLEAVTAALGRAPTELFAAKAHIAVFDDAASVRAASPDMALTKALPRDGLIVTAPGDGGADIVCRYFAPHVGIDEDPVTGSAHAQLVPFWAERLGRDTFVSHQLSARGGELHCRLANDRVILAGAAVTVVEGRFLLP